MSLVTLALCSCSFGGASTAETTGSSTNATGTTTQTPDSAEIRVEAVSDKPGPFASRREYEWAAAWIR